jgi:hypothetical protein
VNGNGGDLRGMLISRRGNRTNERTKERKKKRCALPTRSSCWLFITADACVRWMILYSTVPVTVPAPGRGQSKESEWWWLLFSRRGSRVDTVLSENVGCICRKIPVFETTSGLLKECEDDLAFIRYDQSGPFAGRGIA